MSASMSNAVKQDTVMRKLTEGLISAVIQRDPPRILEFAVVYFSEIMKFKAENPHLTDVDAISQFHHKAVKYMPTSLLEKKSVASQTSTGEVSVSPLRIGSVPRYEESSKQEALDSLLIQKTEWSALQLKSTSAEPEAQLPIQEKEHICAPSRSESLTCPYTGTTPRTGSDGMSKLSYSSTSVPSVGATTLPTTKESLKQVLQDSSLPQKTEEKETMSEPERETFRKPPSCTFDVPVDDTVSEAAHEQKKMSLDHISAVPSVGTTVVQCTSAESFGSISTLTPSVDTTVAQYSPADSFSSISTLMPSVATAAVQFPSVTSLHTIKPPLPTSERSLKQAVQSHSQVMTGMYEVPYIAGATETHSCHTPVQSRPSFQRVYISAPLESEGLTCFHSGKTTPRSDSVKRFSSTSVPKVSTIEVQLPSVNSIHAIKPPLLTSEESSEKATQDSSFPLKTEQPALMMKESMSEPETEPFIRYIYRRPPSDIFEGPLEDVSTARHTLSKTTVKESIECAINETAVSEVRHEEQKISLEHFSASRLKLGLKETLLDSPLPQKSEPSVLTAEPERELLTHSHSQVLAGSYEMPYIAGASETLSSHAPVQSRSLVQHEDISVPLEAVPRISQRVLCSAPVPTVNTATFQFPSFTSVRYITPSLPTSKQSSKQAMHDSSFPQKMEETRTKSETEPLIKYYYQQPPSDTSVVPPESDNLTHCYSDTAVPVSGSDRISKRFISEPSVTISYGQFPTIHPLQTTESSSSASFSKESSKEAVLYFPLSQKNTVSSPPVTPVTSQEVATHQISDVECCCVPTKDDPSVQTEYDAEKQAQETVSSDESSACDETTVVRLHIKYTPSVSPLPSKHSAKQKLLETQNFFPGPQETMSVEVYSKLILSSPKRQLQSQGKIPKEGKRDVGYQEAVSESQDAAVATKHARKSRKHRQIQENVLTVKEPKNAECYSSSPVTHPINLVTQVTSEEISPDRTLPTISTYPQPSLTVDKTTREISPELRLPLISASSQLGLSPEETSGKICADFKPSPISACQGMPTQECREHGRFSNRHTQKLELSPDETAHKTQYIPQPPSGPPRKHKHRVTDCHPVENIARLPSPSNTPTAISVQEVPATHSYTGVSPCCEDVGNESCPSQFHTSALVQQTLTFQSCAVASQEKTTVKIIPSSSVRKYNRQVRNDCHVEGAAVPVQQVPAGTVSAEETNMKTPYAPRPPSDSPRKHGRHLRSDRNVEDAARSASPSDIHTE